MYCSIAVKGVYTISRLGCSTDRASPIISEAALPSGR